MAATKYGAKHQKARARIDHRLISGEIIPCWRCGVALQPGSAWHLDHMPGTLDQYRGPSCVKCNTSDGGRRGQNIKKSRRRPPLLEPHPNESSNDRA